MKELNVIVYTMKGCPFCEEFKKMLSENGIEFFDRDIHKFDDEYKLFVEITDNQYIPSLLIIEGESEGDEHSSFLYAPERDYNELTEAVEIIESHRKKLGII